MNHKKRRIEELEDESVKKASIAKTAGLDAGLSIVGAGVAIAANGLMDDKEEAPDADDTDNTGEKTAGGASQEAQNSTINKVQMNGKAYAATEYNGDDMANGTNLNLNGDDIFTHDERTTLVHTTDCRCGCILTGTAAPVILTSRSDDVRTKVNSIALAAVVAGHHGRLLQPAAPTCLQAI